VNILKIGVDGNKSSNFGNKNFKQNLMCGYKVN